MDYLILRLDSLFIIPLDIPGCWGFHGATCIPRNESSVTCCHRKGYFQHVKSLSTFYFCHDWDTIPCMCLCRPPLQYFNPELKKCSTTKPTKVKYKIDEYIFNNINKPDEDVLKTMNQDDKRYDVFKQTKQETEDVMSIHFVDSSGRTEDKVSVDFPPEIRDDPNFPMWAVTFLVLCLVCISVAVILYLY